MNITLPEKERIKKKQLIAYIVIILICIVALLIASYVQFYARIDIAEMVGLKQKYEYGNKTEEDVQVLKSSFDNIFDNDIKNDNGNNNKKIYKNEKLVYTNYEEKTAQEGDYEIDVNIPYINVNNDVVKEYNKEIEESFIAKAKNVLNSNNRNTIYTVDYTANVEQDILSVIIRSRLKEGSSAQRVIIQTYNYDLRNNKEISLQEILRIEQLDRQSVQKLVNSTIEEEEKKVESLKQLNYNVFQRNLASSMYNIENKTNFYYTKDALYIIYAYGNESYTSEMDLIVI